MYNSKGELTKKYDKEFWGNFKHLSDKYLPQILNKAPDIGKSIFAFNYKFGICFIAWYKAFKELGISNEEIDRNIWIMNEKMLDIFPKIMLPLVGKIYINGFRQKALEHFNRQENGELHPYDWKINYREINNNSFEIDITQCAILKIAVENNARNLLPGICRMDYLFSHLMGNGFERTKTLGDGNDCCNCRYHIVGTCEWKPEKGFIHRK